MKTLLSRFFGLSADAIIVALFIIILGCSALDAGAATSHKVAPGEYGPISQQVIDQMFAEHGFTKEQQKLFRVIRLVPFELGGTNARANLAIASIQEAKDHDTLARSLLNMANRNLISYDKAAATLAAWKPGQISAK